MTLAVGVGCAPAVISRPAPVEPPPPVTTVPTPLPALPRAERYTIPAEVPDTRYKLNSVTGFERDSAGHRENQRLSSEALVVVRLRRRASGALNASGQVLGYAVQSALSSQPIAIDSVRFDAVLDSLALRVVSRPPLVNECDRPETGALTLVRDLLLRVPASLSVGDQWRDSTIALVCRSSLPMVVRTVADYVVTGSVRDGGGLLLVIRRTSSSRVEGKFSSPWRSVAVSGGGTATLDVRVSVETGAVERFESTSTLTLSVSDRTSAAAMRTQQVTQRVRLTGAKIVN